MAQTVRVVVISMPGVGKGDNAFVVSGLKLTGGLRKHSSNLLGPSQYKNDKDVMPFDKTQPFPMDGKEKKRPLFGLYVLSDKGNFEPIAQVEVWRFVGVNSTPLNSRYDFPAELKFMERMRSSGSRELLCMHIANLRYDNRNTRDGVEAEACTYLLMAAVGKMAMEKGWDIVSMVVHPDFLPFYKSMGFVQLGRDVPKLYDIPNSPASLIYITRKTLLERFEDSILGRMSKKLIIEGGTSIKCAHCVYGPILLKSLMSG